jgi:hypothetical protein
MIEFLQHWGITIPQLTTFLAAIPVAYLSAKFGARESRRQYKETASIARRQAAAELIYPLMAFALACNRITASPSVATGALEQLAALQRLQLPPECDRNAAIVGADVAARTLKLRILKTTIENALDIDAGVGCPAPDPEATSRFCSYVALLELRARWVADLASKNSGLPVSHTEAELNALLGDAMRYGFEMDIGEEGRWPLPSHLADVVAGRQT